MVAVVAHLLDVLAGGGVGLCAHDPAVGVHHHAEGVRECDPVDGVGVHGEVPVGDLAGVNAGDECEVAGDHEALDVVAVGRIEHLADAVLHARHVRLAGPVEVGE